MAPKCRVENPEKRAWDRALASVTVRVVLVPVLVLLLFTLCPLTTDYAGATNLPTRSTAEDCAQYVDPFIGTSGTGHTFPGATVPFGLVQLSPDTGNGSWPYCAGYQYADTRVRGFSHTHISGGGIGDLGDVLMLPFSDLGALAGEDVPFSKADEKASTGYYATVLTDDAIKVELTATERTGLQRYTFEKGGAAHVLISIDRILFSSGTLATRRVAEGGIAVDDERSLSGWYRSKAKVARQVFFAVHFDEPFADSRYLDDSNRRRLVVDYALKPGQSVQARVSISTVSPEGAKENLRAESIGKTFDQIRSNAVEAWNRYLSRIVIKGTDEQKKIFYTSLYHLLIQPNNIADSDGRYRGADGEVHTSESGSFYSTIALWDIYRGAFPLYTIIAPEKVSGFVNALLAHHDQTGYLPVWPLWGVDSRVMIGNHAVAVIADACLKGIKGIDAERSFAAIKTTLTRNSWRKYDWSVYDKYGYLPSDMVQAEAVSCTLEATFDDYCAAQLAKALGKSADHAFFARRADYYKNLFDSDTGFMRGRTSDGKWVEPFDPLEVFHAGTSNGDYTEGNAWQYLWTVQHDIEGLAALLGGKQAFANKLDMFFSLAPRVYGKGNTKDVSGLVGQYAHGNEPSQHVIYLYNYAGKPHRTQELIRQVLTTLYRATPDGLSGNDDFGQMSAWYVLSALGFYPVSPASGQYDLGVPAHEFAQIRLNDKTFTIRATNFGPERRYVRRVTLNGEPVTNYQIGHEALMSGGELVFEMSGTTALPAPD